MKQAFLKIIDKEMKEPQHYEVLKYMTDFRLKIEKMDYKHVVSIKLKQLIMNYLLLK